MANFLITAQKNSEEEIGVQINEGNQIKIYITNSNLRIHSDQKIMFWKNYKFFSKKLHLLVSKVASCEVMIFCPAVRHVTILLKTRQKQSQMAECVEWVLHDIKVVGSIPDTGHFWLTLIYLGPQSFWSFLIISSCLWVETTRNEPHF